MNNVTNKKFQNQAILFVFVFNKNFRIEAVSKTIIVTEGWSKLLENNISFRSGRLEETWDVKFTLKCIEKLQMDSMAYESNN